MGFAGNYGTVALKSNVRLYFKLENHIETKLRFFFSLI